MRRAGFQVLSALLLAWLIWTYPGLAETVVGNTRRGDAEILQMDSMQSVNAQDVGGGRSYLRSMERNLEVLKQATR